MAKQEDVIDIDWVEETFARNKSFIFHKMQDILEKKKYVMKMKSKIGNSEVQIDSLKEYLKSLETMIRKSSKIGQLTLNLTNEIKDVQRSIVHVKQGVAALESKRKFETKPNIEDQKLVSNMKKVLIELYESNFDLLIQKEKRSVELKNLSKEDNASTMFKQKNVELDILVREYESMKAKNIHLREILSMNIEQKL